MLNVKAWIVDGEIRCASQKCDLCSKEEEHGCEPMVLCYEDEIMDEENDYYDDGYL